MQNTPKAVTVFLMTLMILAAPQVSFGQASIGVSVSIGPPPLPVYVQPPCPGPRFIWVPGYWAWDGSGYYWVPGTWVFAPRPGLLWTPGYWGWREGLYVWHPGYWGARVGYYGGINYGFGYTGFGYVGGYWHRGAFFYNRSANNVNVTVIHNTYYRTVVRDVALNRVSYNGGPGGIALRPTPAQEVYEHQRHFGMTRSQELHERTARGIRALRASVNHGRPVIAATARPGDFRGRGAVPAAMERGRYRPRVGPMRPERHYVAPGRPSYNRHYRPADRGNFFQHVQPPKDRGYHFRQPQPENGRYPNPRQRRHDRRQDNGRGYGHSY